MSQAPPLSKKPCGCEYSHWYDASGPGCGPSGWYEEDYPAIVCAAHRPAETARQAAVHQKLQQETEERRKRELQRLEKEAAVVKEKARADLTRIAKRRYELEHGVDRTQLEAALAKAKEDVQRLTAELDKLPPMSSE